MKKSDCVAYLLAHNHCFSAAVVSVARDHATCEIGPARVHIYYVLRYMPQIAACKQ